VAQQTREEERAAAQAEKAKNLHPYEPTKIEQRIQRMERAFLNPPPVYAFIGSVYPGGFLAVGPGYRGRYAESGSFDVHAAWSVRNYKTVGGFLKLPDVAGGRIRTDVRGSWLDAPSVAFYGLGNASRLDQKTSFLYRATTVGAAARFAPASFFSAGVGLDVMDIDTGSGARGASIEQKFPAAFAPGLGASPRYVRSRVFADVDWRASPGYTRRGGHYRVDWADYNETASGPYSFHRLDIELDQFVPLLRENWVLAFRGLASLTDPSPGAVVPYFLTPSLGGSSELRGYPSWRFRDRHRILFTGEYRWMAGQFIDMALFLDAGKVADRRSELDLHELKTSYGLGVRFHAPSATALRVEIARTPGEGTGIVFAFGPAF
jgi:Omp85 superfamily domain